MEITQGDNMTSQVDVMTSSAPTMNSSAAALTCSEQLFVNVSWHHWSYDIEHFIYSRLTSSVCAFGLLGNLINIIVLIQRTSRGLKESMERSVYFGLVALAVSDMAFCLSVLPHVVVDRRLVRALHDSVTLSLVYEGYHNVLINTFAASSTWLTVYMAVSRCLAICFPLKTRAMFSLNFTKYAVVAIFGVSVLLNVPRFWLKTIVHFVCYEQNQTYQYYYLERGPLVENLSYRKAYTYVHFVLCILLPLILMAISNTFLIRELREAAVRRKTYTRSFRREKERRGSRSPGGSSSLVTLTLVLIVIFYFILVVPVEVMSFFYEVASEMSDAKMQMYNVGLAIANCLQSINFSFNFILYCTLSVQFRQSVLRVLCCCRTENPFVNCP